MKNRTQTLILLLLLAGLAACSPPSETANPANNNAAQQSQPPQGGTPAADNATPVTSVQANSKEAPQVAAQPAAPTLAPVAAKRDAAPAAEAPKLVVPVKRIDFGRQPKDKTLVRTIAIKNGGKSELKIDAVEPS